MSQEVEKANEEFDRLALVGGASTPTARMREGRRAQRTTLKPSLKKAAKPEPPEPPKLKDSMLSVGFCQVLLGAQGLSGASEAFSPPRLLDCRCGIQKPKQEALNSTNALQISSFSVLGRRKKSRQHSA